MYLNLIQCTKLTCKVIINDIIDAINNKFLNKNDVIDLTNFFKIDSNS